MEIPHLYTQILLVKYNIKRYRLAYPPAGLLAPPRIKWYFGHCALPSSALTLFSALRRTHTTTYQPCTYGCGLPVVVQLLTPRAQHERVGGNCNGLRWQFRPTRPAMARWPRLDLSESERSRCASVGLCHIHGMAQIPARVRRIWCF